MASKLEMYVAILHVLAERGPLKLSKIPLEANVSSNTLKGYLDFLIKQGLIEEKLYGKQSVVYAITARGEAVIKFFTKQDRMLPEKQEDNTFLPFSH